jgi:fumarate hydratase class II
MTAMRKETDSLGVVEVPEDKLWEDGFDRIVDPSKMVKPYVAKAA